MHIFFLVGTMKIYTKRFSIDVVAVFRVPSSPEPKLNKDIE